MYDKLVYRSLRKISEWALDGFYSEVHVSGQENVPATGPVILTPCHHNEILDIAALSVTIPHGRPICFWAKSTMFTNPILRAIMTSSGSIPVRRNPNSTSSLGSGQDNSAKESRFELFRETFRALDADEVIGVFPEGTSYTEPQIAQIKEGAAWVALEYARWQQQRNADGPHGKPKTITLIPVGIVYDDNTRFKSRVFVNFGKSVDLEEYITRHLVSSDPHDEVRSLTKELEERIYKLTVNAASWDLCFAGRIAKDILANGASVSSPESFVTQSQLCIDRLITANDAQATNELVKYYALLHYTGISHDAFTALYPSTHSPTRLESLTTFARQLAISLVHPRSLLFVPVGLIHIPTYITGACAGRYLANLKEPETIAEHKAVCGGLAFGATSAFISTKVPGLLYRALSTTAQQEGFRVLSDWATRAESLLPIGIPRQIAGTTCRIIGMFTLFYWTTWVLFRWHKAFAPWNYKQLQRVSASWTIFLGTWFPPSKTLTQDQLASPSRPPIPAPNRYIKRRGDVATEDTVSKPSPARSSAPPRPSFAHHLVSHLFSARADAEAAVRGVFGASRASARS